MRLDYHLAVTYILFNSYPEDILRECLLVNMVDIDHLLADPVYDKTRNSFETHPLHIYWYGVLCLAFLFLSSQAVLSLMIHYFMDYIDPDVIN